MTTILDLTAPDAQFIDLGLDSTSQDPQQDLPAVSSETGPVITSFDSSEAGLPITEGHHQDFIFTTSIDISAQINLWLDDSPETDLDLYLYADINGNLAFENDELIGESFNEAGENEAIFSYLPGGFLYLASVYGYQTAQDGSNYILELATGPDDLEPTNIALNEVLSAGALETYNTHSYSFTIPGEPGDPGSGTYIYLEEFGVNDLDLFLFAAPGGILGPQLKTSEQGAGEPESLFKYLLPGDYIAKVYGYNTDTPTSYSLFIDTTSFEENALTPNDPLFPLQWHHLNDGQSGGIDFADIYTPEAWAITTGSSDVIIAIIDTGVAFNHVDLNANIWINSAEIPDNGIDDDSNSYTDDVNGWDFYFDDNYPFFDGDPQDHGTHVAGIAAGVGNNGIGIAGVSWNSQIMPLRVFDENNSGAPDSAILEAIYYAVDNGADIINLSLGSTFEGDLSGWQLSDPETYQQYLDAFAYATNHGVTTIIAAGNEAVSTEEYISTPAIFSTLNDGVISVAALNNRQNLSSYSNYGHKVTVAAPGGDNAAPTLGIFSTLPNDTYDYMPGTSMAAPVVAGVAALMKSINPGLTPAEIKALLISSADQLKWLEGLTEQGSSINAYSAVVAARDYIRPVTENPGGNTSSPSGAAAASNSASTAPSSPSSPSSENATTTATDNPQTPSEPSSASTVLGIQPQAEITTVNLPTPLTIGNLQISKAVVGTSQRDSITGSDEGEALSGGEGKDRMTGGGGADAFLFETVGEFGRRSIDTITDFNPSEGDKITLSREVFGEISRISFTAAAGRGQARQMDNTNKNVIYDNKSGILYFNENGKKDGWGDGGEFAKLVGSLDLSRTDFALI
jgi:subtilisin family serine protease